MTTPYTRSRIIGNAHNKVRGAAIAASAQRASTQVHLLAQDRTGNGAMALSGAYAGGADTVVDVEVLGGPDGALTTSSPVLQGVGNGTVEVQGIDVGAVPQTMRFTLLDAGKAPTPAILDFFGVQLAAREAGTLGNSIALTVTRNLTYTDLPFSTLDPISAGATSFEGPQFDWGQPPGSGGDVPAGALRFAFAGIPQVLRAWKVWKEGRFTYRIDPAVAYPVAENTRIRQVAGDYTLTVTDGTATEVYTAVTMFEFLSQVQARSALLQVLGVVADDRAPGGQAVTDIPLRTDAHALPVIASVRRPVTLQVGAVQPTAPTENITITCMGRAAGAAQSWSVSGGVSGALPAATTGVPYTAGPVGFTVPPVPTSVALGATITGRFSPTARAPGEGLPAICFKPLLLGVAAIDKEVTFVYRKRPPADCSCSSAPALYVNLQCLGLLPEGEVIMDPALQTRLVSLTDWHAQFVASNVGLRGAAIMADGPDIEVAGACVRVLSEALAEIYDTPAAVTAWDGVFEQLVNELHAYRAVEGGSVLPWTTRGMRTGLMYHNPENGHTYRVDEITVGGTVVDATPVDTTVALSNTATWLTNGTQFTVPEVTAATVTVSRLAPPSPWGRFTTTGQFDFSSTGAGPRVKIEAITIKSSSAVASSNGAVWEASSFSDSFELHGKDAAGVPILARALPLPGLPAGANVGVGRNIVNKGKNEEYAVTAITVGGVAANYAEMRLPSDWHASWPASGSATLTMPAPLRGAVAIKVTDMGVSDALGLRLEDLALSQQSVIAARRIQSDQGREYFALKYQTSMNWVRAIAGISPKSDASSGGSTCWRDYGDAFWWEDGAGFYLPLFTNKPYVSAMRDAQGAVVGTQEFGVGMVTACEHRLKEGDSITIRIAGTHNQAAWAEGDKFTIPIIAAGSAPLTGGTDGNPIQTWTARSSVLGALPDWLFNPAAPAPYTAGPADVALLPGGIPFDVGDNIAFDIECGKLRWRRDGGAWATGDLYGPPLDLGDGLLLEATAGAAPSFLAGDAWQFRAVATYGTDRLRQPRVGRAFAWDGPAVTLDVDLGAAVPVEAVLLALHEIAPGAAVTVSGGLAAPDEWSEPLVLHPVVAFAQVDPAHRAAVRYLRVSITGAGAGGSIGWLWAGTGWQPTCTPRITRTRTWALSRGAGINAGALYRGAGVAGSWSWALNGEDAALLANSYDELFAVLDHAAREGAEALAMVPDLDSPADAALCTIDTEQIEASDERDWQSTAARVVSLSLPLRPVLV